eukprot:35981_1
MILVKINMMKTYIRPNSQVSLFMIYYRTPDGIFVGTAREPNTTQLKHIRRDNSWNLLNVNISKSVASIQTYTIPQSDTVFIIGATLCDIFNTKTTVYHCYHN